MADDLVRIPDGSRFVVDDRRGDLLASCDQPHGLFCRDTRRPARAGQPCRDARMGHAGSAAPLPERGEQPLPRLVGHRLGGKFAEGTHGEAHLVEVAVAAVAFGEVGDEAALGLRVELVFQVRSDQLDELIAVEH